MASSRLSHDEWIARLRPPLADSMDAVSERITSHPSVQSWLQDASFNAMQGMGGVPSMQAEAQAYGAMLDDLTASFPELVGAVDALTHGCGQLDLHWRPLEPNYSRVYVDFGRAHDVDLCYPLDAVSREAVAAALQAVREALPAGTPFPNRPNTATGLVVHHGTGVGVRYTDRVGENDRRWQRVTLLAPDREPLDDLTAADATDTLVRYLQAAP